MLAGATSAAAAPRNAPARLPLTYAPTPGSVQPTCARDAGDAAYVTVPDIAAFLLCRGYEPIEVDWPRAGPARFTFRDPKQDVPDVVRAYPETPEAAFANAVYNLRRAVRTVPASWDPFAHTELRPPASCSLSSGGARARAYIVADERRGVIRVYDLDFAAFMLVHNAYLIDAAEVRDHMSAYDFYDANGTTPALALRYLWAPEARFAACVRNLKKIVYSDLRR